jgi:PilZ domain
MSGIYEFGYRTPRFRTDFHFLLQTDGPEPRLLDARCLDISEEGIAAQIAEHLRIGAVATLIITFPGSTTTSRVAARVCNRQDEDHGFLFLFSAQSQREDVHKFVARLRGDTVRISRSR